MGFGEEVVRRGEDREDVMNWDVINWDGMNWNGIVRGRWDLGVGVGVWRWG